MVRKKYKSYKDHDLSPEDVLLDAHNMPRFNEHQFEGRMAGRIPARRGYVLMALFFLLVVVFTGRLFVIQITHGEQYAAQSTENHLDHDVLFADRGIIRDRTGEPLAWNEPQDDDYGERRYIEKAGLGHLLGYISYPKRDSSGNYYDTDYRGVSGAESAYNDILAGEKGVKIVETDALMDVLSENTITYPEDGGDVTLSIDAGVQGVMYDAIKEYAERLGFIGGAGVIMDVETGELLAMTSYPEYSPQVIVEGKDDEVIASYQEENTPFLNRATKGLFTPGSVVKPFVALGVLTENLINPRDRIRSTGEIRVENPYSPGVYSVFRDWKAHGLVDIVDAIAVSSNVYFYVVGGGYGDQKGLGITKLNQYFNAFEIADETGFTLSESSGTVPNPKWKESVFEGEPWRLGDTYHTAIGQYGFLVTPLQLTRAISGIAREGTLVSPHIRKGERGRVESISTHISDDAYMWVKRGMREGVLRGTASGLNVSYIDIAAKTGTAEVGSEKVHSWVTGYFPADNPKYVFTLVMERGPRTNLVGATAVMRQVIDWMKIYTPEYLALPSRDVD